jgi:hypothetical protein
MHDTANTSDAAEECSRQHQQRWSTIYYERQKGTGAPTKMAHDREQQPIRATTRTEAKDSSGKRYEVTMAPEVVQIWSLPQIRRTTRLLAMMTMSMIMKMITCNSSMQQ